MIKRDLYLTKLRPFYNMDIVKVLTGIRRCGKSTLLKLVQEDLVEQGVSSKQIFSINFESLTRNQQDMMQTYSELTEFAASHQGKSYFFLDEIQELSNWEKMINSLRVDIDCDIYLTGSNSKLLSGELATYLAGRYVEIAVHPFSFSEIMEAEQISVEARSADEMFASYLRYGGMPFIYENKLDSQATINYLRDIFNSILLKDIISRHAIRDVELFERVILYFLANIGNTFSGITVMKYLKNEGRKLSQETLYNYISYAEEACLLHLAGRFDVQGKRLLQFQEKIYLADQGIREAIYGNNERDINQILENIVYQELIRRGYKTFIGKTNTKEIDFVAEKGSQIIYVQVAYLLADESVIKREFSSLAEVSDNYPKYVLSMDKFDFSRDGIIHMNIIEFLLHANSI